MTILDKLNRIRHKYSDVGDFCIRTVRFKKLLENATALLDLFEDGNEKLKGEYILDGHYVTTLVDDIIDKLSLVVYDACTLASEKGRDLYARFDRHKSHIGDRLSRYHTDDRQAATVDETSDPKPLLYPEYRLLSDVLVWFNSRDSEISVMELMKQAMVEGVMGIHAQSAVKHQENFKIMDFPGTDKSCYYIDLWKDPIEKLKQSRSLENTDNFLLKLLFAQVLNSGSSSSRILGDWVAVAGVDDLSVNTLTPDVNFRLNAAMSSHEKSNYIFIFADNALNPEQMLPSGFDLEKTASGLLAWKRNTSAAVIEDNLVAIGKNLFGNGK